MINRIFLKLRNILQKLKKFLYKLRGDRFIIKRAKNGLVVYAYINGSREILTHTEGESEYKAFTYFLWELIEHYGPQQNKWGDEQIYVVVAPGFKNEKFTSFDDAFWGEQKK